MKETKQDQPDLIAPKSPLKKLAICLIAAMALLVVAGGYMEFGSQFITKWIVGFWKPPRVEMQESYVDNAEGVTFEFDHSPLDLLLGKFVDQDGWVDYRALRADEQQLDVYLQSLNHAELEQMGRDERLAFLINAYNAFTLKLIVENYPLDSIKDIPAEERWDAVRWQLAGRTVSLNQLEHEWVRPHFKEPRIHFALVCAAIGCPPLRNEAYQGRQIEHQLNEQTTYVHAHRTWFHYDRQNGLALTQLYNWYGDDFAQVIGSVEEFASEYSDELKRDLQDQEGHKIEIRWLKYDWGLNDRKRKAPR